MKFRNAILAATMLAAPAAAPVLAHAQPVTGVYLGGGLGYNIMSTEKLKTANSAVGSTNLNSKALLHNGFAGEASVGYGFGNGFRVELEGDYYDNQFNKLHSGGSLALPAGQYTASGNEKKYGAMVNGFYDFDIGLPYLFPYVGAGVGYQEVDLKNFHAAALPGTSIDSSKGAFAYQAIAGLAYPVPGAPGLSVTAEYRFMGLTGSRSYHGTFGGTPASFKFGDEYNNTVMLGLRYQLFTPAPAMAPAPAPTPVAAPAPAPARTYLVFFDWNKSNLTPRATQIVSEAAADSQRVQTTTIDVSGYTDTSGTPAYNDKLSMRRAQTVAAQLVADGVSKSEIEIHAYGETHLLVPTGPGVREPQNRRVEIVLK
jgi:outer membrane protein OmpA-like peptidoglycan-associated protein